VARMGDISTQVEQEVGVAVTALQFQDMGHQLLGHIRRRLRMLRPIDGADAGGDWRALQRAMRRSADRLASLEQAPVQQRDVAEGGVELF